VRHSRLPPRRTTPFSSWLPTPLWCVQRYGQSITFLPDGRVVLIGGKHEDPSADFCVFNDVFVQGPDGSIASYGYPQAVFPPTDFHTATLMDDGIYVIGSRGYEGRRRHGETPVYRLDVATFRIERVDAGGESPGWIFQHRALRLGPAEIRVWGGKVAAEGDGEEVRGENTRVFVIDVARGLWRADPPVLT
jgi:hypothetical protein